MLFQHILFNNKNYKDKLNKPWLWSSLGLFGDVCLVPLYLYWIRVKFEYGFVCALWWLTAPQYQE